MKTKKQLLAKMERMGACYEAREWVENHRAQSAERIGLSCQRPYWLMWFLWRALDHRSRELFAARLGMVKSDFYGGVNYSESDVAFGYRPHIAYGNDSSRNLSRRVINDCWRAWCRSKS